jgi:hypothetical protein
VPSAIGETIVRPGQLLRESRLAVRALPIGVGATATGSADRSAIGRKSGTGATWTAMSSRAGDSSPP